MTGRRYDVDELRGPDGTLDLARARQLVARAAPSFALVGESARAKARVASGEANEDWITRLNADCLARGIARMHKVTTPLKQISAMNAKGVCQARSAGKARADYEGMMLDGTARHVCVEAKRQASGKFVLDEILDHQAEELTRIAYHGGVSVLLLTLGRHHDLFAVPWHALATVHGPTACALLTDRVGREDLAPLHRVAPGEPYLQRFVRRAARAVEVAR